MAKIRLTESLAWAAATDAGNRSMRAAGRTKWGFEDRNAAIVEFNRIWVEPTFGPLIVEAEIRVE